MEKEINIISWEQNILHHRIVSAVKTVEFVSDRTSYILLRGYWYNIIVLNVPALSEKESNDSKDSFYEQLEQGFFITFLRTSYILLRGYWYNIIVLNVPALSEKESNDSKDSFYEQLEQGFFFITFLSTTWKFY